MPKSWKLNISGPQMDGSIDGRSAIPFPFKVIAGESASVSEEMVAPLAETTLPTILSQFKAEDIYNIDECGLFHQALPNRPLHPSKEKCHGGKQSKVRITALCGVNAVISCLCL